MVKGQVLYSYMITPPTQLTIAFILIGINKNEFKR